MTDKPSSPLAGILASRKGVLMLFLLVMATLLELAIVVLAIRGKMTIEAAIQTSLGALFLGMLGPLATINGIAKEDAAAKGSPTIAAVSVSPIPFILITRFTRPRDTFAKERGRWRREWSSSMAVAATASSLAMPHIASGRPDAC